jgi:hypothetical protein
VGLFEVMPVTRGIRELVVERASESALRDAALAAGMRSMRSDGLRKALAGRTTLEEVLRVTPPDPSVQRRARRGALSGSTATGEAKPADIGG